MQSNKKKEVLFKMDLNNIQLTRPLCHNLFAKTLVEETNIVGTTKETETIKIISMGNNKKKIALVVNNKEYKYLSDAEMNLLFDLLGACKLTMADISLINYNNDQNINYQDITEQLRCKTMLMFGVKTEELGLPFSVPFFQIQKFQEQTYLLTPPLDNFLDNIALKKQLWNCLKILFLTK